MKTILYNPEQEDVDKYKDALIIDLFERYDHLPNAINFRDLKQEYKLISQTWLQRWGYRKVNDKTIREIFSYDGTTIFYLLSYFFQRFYSKEGFFFNKPGIKLTMMIIHILNRELNEDVKVISRDPYNNHFVPLIKRFCKEKGYGVAVVNLPCEASNKKVSNGLLKNLFRIRIGLRWLIGFVRRFFHKRWFGSDVFILSSIRFSRKEDKDNILFGNLAKGLEENEIDYKIINYDNPDPKNLKTVVKKHAWHDTFYMGDYYRIKTLIDNEKTFNSLKKKWLNLRNQREFVKTFTYKGFNFYPEAKDLMDDFFNSTAYLVADCLNITKEIIRLEEPKMFVLDHEENFYGKGLLLSARDTGIKCLALQHEACVPGDTNHSHIKDDKALDSLSVHYRPLPDYKCVSGSLAKKVLLDECNYPEKIIKVTGRSNFDDLKDIKRKKGNKRKTILYAAEYLDVTKEFMEVASLVHWHDYIIKPHPEHKMNSFLATVWPYLVIQHRAGRDNIKIVDKDANIHDFFPEVNLVVSSYCTVGFEALYAGIPFIVFNPKREKDVYGFRNGGIPEINTKKNLRAILDKDIKIGRKVKTYLKKHLYKTDGKATERIAKIIVGGIK